MKDYENLALTLQASIKALAEDDDKLNNFVSYLTAHFSDWMEKYANTPEGLTQEFAEFSGIKEE